MKKLTLSIVYPLWLFFGKTWLGNVLMLCICVIITPGIIFIIFPELLLVTGEEAEGLGTGIGFFSLLCSPLVGAFFMNISSLLEKNYKLWGYKIPEKY